MPAWDNGIAINHLQRTVAGYDAPVPQLKKKKIIGGNMKNFRTLLRCIIVMLGRSASSEGNDSINYLGVEVPQ